MFCARCQRVFSSTDRWTWAILPGGTQPVPTCWDDRVCERIVRRISRQASSRMQRVRQIASRYIRKGVGA